MNARFRPLTLGLAGIAMLAFGSASALAQQTTIRIAHLFTGSDTAAPVFDKLLDAWVAAHPEVNLVREETQGDDHRLKLATDLAANNVPDIFYNWVGPADITKFVDAGLALDVREYLALSKNITADDWTEAQFNSVSVNGVPYALPTAGFKCFTFYNTALFDQYKQTPPKTWDELLAVSKVFSDAGIVPIDTGSKGGNPGHLVYNVILSQMPNGQAEAEAALSTFNVSTPAFVEAAKIVKELIEAKAFPADSVANGDWSASIALYNQGKAAMLFTCPWMIEQITPDIAAVSEMMYFPTVRDAAVEGSAFNVGNINNGWMINRASFADPAKQAIMIDLLDAIHGDDVKRGLIESGMFPGWVVGDLSAYDLSPLAAKVHTFTATSPGHYAGLYSFMGTAGSLTAFMEASDRMFAGDEPEAIISDFQSTLDREKP